MATTTLTQGIEEYETIMTFGDGIDITGTATVSGNVSANSTLNTIGCKKFQVFAGSLAATNGGTTTYSDNDNMVELGALDVTIADSAMGIVTASKIFIDKVKVLVTTASGGTHVGNLQLSATAGTATNAALTSGTEIVGAGVASFNPRISATDAVTEVDINFNSAAVHVFEPNIAVASTLINLYACTTTTLNSDSFQAGRFTVMVEYTVF
jgi:hypothetical protein